MAMDTKKLCAVALLLVMVLPAFLSAQPVSAAPLAITSPTDWGGYVRVYALTNTTISNDNSTYATVIAPSVTTDTTAEYFQYVFYAKNITAGLSWVELFVPESYAGLSVECWNGAAWVNKDGDAAFSLSVPVLWNNSDIISGSAYSGAAPADWGTLALHNASGLIPGSLRRVVLAVNNTALGVDEAKLRITTYYATAPAVGFDGRNDLVTILSSDTLNFGDDTASILAELKAGYGQVLTKGEGYPTLFFNSTGGLEVVYSAVDEALYPYGVCYGDGYIYVADTYNHRIVQRNSDDLSWLNYCKWAQVGYGLPAAFSFVSNSTGQYADSFIALDFHYFSNINPLYVGRGYRGCIYSLSISSALSINASSFSGGSSNATVVDFSGAGNHGTAYGNVQYKTYKGTGFLGTMVFIESAAGFTIVSYGAISGAAYDGDTGRLTFTTQGTATVTPSAGLPSESFAVEVAGEPYEPWSLDGDVITISEIPYSAHVCVDFEVDGEGLDYPGEAGGWVLGIVQGAVRYSPVTVLDDSIAGWWAHYSFALSLDGVHYYGSYSAKCVAQAGATDGALYSRRFPSDMNFSNYEVMGFYFKGSATGKTILAGVQDAYGVYSYYSFIDISAAWAYHELHLNAPTFDKSAVRGICFWMAGDSVPGTFYLDRVQFKDTQTVKSISGSSDLRGHSIYLNQTAAYGLTAIANETGGAIAFRGFNGGKFVFTNGSVVVEAFNITSDTLYFYPNATVENWRVTWQPDTKTLTVSTFAGLGPGEAGNAFSIGAFTSWIQAQWGIGAYLVLMLVPISLFVKTKEPGIPILFLLFLGAGGLTLPESTGLRPLVILTIIAVFGLGAYRVFWPKDS